MCEKTLKFGNIRYDKKEFHKSKQPINLDLVNIDQIVISDKFKHSDDGFKDFIGYKESEIVKPLCIVLPQMSGSYNTLKIVAKTCLSLLKMMMRWIITMRFRTSLKRH